MPDDCITVSSCSDYGTTCVSPSKRSLRVHESKQHAAGIEASKTVQYNNHWMDTDWKAGKTEPAKPGRAPAWVYALQTKKRLEPPVAENGDPVKHEHIRPRSWIPRSMRRMGYEHGASRQTWNLQNSQKNTGPLKGSLSREEMKELGSKVHISSLNEIIYNIGGAEDLMPAATNNFVKADLPASRQQQYENNCRNLALFEQDRSRNHYSAGGNPQLQESADMYLCMHGCAENEAMGDFQEPPLYKTSSPGYSATKSSYASRSPKSPGYDNQSPRGRRSLEYSPSEDYYSDYFSERGSRMSAIPSGKPRSVQRDRKSVV